METKEQHELLKVKFGVIPVTVYRGCIVEKAIGGYIVFGRKALTVHDVDDIINNAGEAIKQSIK